MVTTCPDIPDKWRGNRSQTARILGIAFGTLDKYAQLGSRAGGINRMVNKQGRIVYAGKEVKRFWHDYMMCRLS